MAGTLQTGTLVDGQWMTTNVDVSTVLERHQERKQEGLQTENDMIASFGVLTQTVISSPIIRWIFPARIRSSEHRDVAFVGDNFVQIRRLDSNGHFHDVARKSGFEQRIRNACIIGTSDFEGGATGDTILSSQLHDRNRDILMVDAVEPELIPPQFILLVLESGDLTFLFARNVGMDVEFISSRHNVINIGITEPQGKHLKVDPSSRYVAVSASENSFSIYALKSNEDLSTQRLHGDSFHHIASEQRLHVRGVIHKMEFLYPAADDPDHIILLLLIVRNRSTAMFVYEWEAGQRLTEIRSNNLKALLFVSAESIMECHNLLEGSPTFRVVPQPEFAVSAIHLGGDVPLWTAWTRPLRHARYSKGHDDIYMAREDGFIAFVEIILNSSVLVQSTIAAGNFRSNIGTAFTNLELAPDGMDFLITGGDSCDGGSYLVAAKKWAQLVEPILNWAPTIDFVTTARTQSPAASPQGSSDSSKRRRLALDDSDKVFACTGRGSHGAVSEIRYGYEARVRLDIEGINYPVTETWPLPLRLHSQGLLSSAVPSSLLFLLSVGDESILLHLTADLKEIEEIPQSSTWLDLKFRTLAACAYNGLVVQVTERTIVVSAEPVIMQVEGVQAGVCRKEYPSGQTIVAAAIFENELALIVIRDEKGDLQLSALRVNTRTSSTNVVVNQGFLKRPHIEVFGSSFPLSQYPNAISIVRQSDGSTYGIICAAESAFTRDPGISAKSNMLSLSAIFNIQDTEGLLRIENAVDYWPLDQSTECGVVPEACVSIANLRGLQCDPGQNELLLAGYRSGMLVMICYKMISKGVLSERRTSRYPMGSTPVTFKTDPAVPNVALVCCDSKLWRVTYDCLSNAEPMLHRVWFTDVETPLHLQLPVNHASILPQGLLLYSGNQLLVTSLDPEAKPIPRRMPLLGSPHRLLYSHRLGKIIVGMAQEGRSTIKFLDPQSGGIVGRHFDSADRLVAFPSGLGIAGEKILCLVEWEWKASSTKADFVILGTSEGSLLIYKTELPDPTKSRFTQQDEIRCVAFLEEHYEAPVSTIVTCANSFFFCVGEIIRWVTVDVSAEKLLTHAEHKLSSRAISISVDGHWLNVLTVKHSLVTLLLVDKRKHPKLGDQHGKLAPQFADETERNGLDQIPLTSDFYDKIKEDATIVLVGDSDCTVAGLWYCKKTQSVVSNHRIIFEVDLPCSILKFRVGRTRPPWDRILKSSETKSTYHAGELLGMGVDGSITHFSLLEEGAWRLLRFLQNLTHRSSESSSLSHIPRHIGSKPDPRTKHVDGEILRPYLSHRRLERLLMTDEARVESSTDSRVIEEFCSLVNELPHEDASLSEQSGYGSLEKCLEVTYRFLADVLRPVL